MPTSVLLLHFTPPSVVGGVEVIVRQHAELLAGSGFDVELAAGRTGHSAFPLNVIEEIDPTRAENVTLERSLAAGAVPSLFASQQQTIQTKLAALTARFDYVIVHNAFTLHFCLPLTAALWELAAARPEGTTIGWSHDLSWTNPLYQPEMHPGYPWELLRLPAPHVRYVAISHERQQELQELWGTGNVELIPNGMNVENFLRLSSQTRSIIERFKLFESDLVLLLPARVTRRKNIELGIRIVAALRARGLSVRYLITGPIAPHHPGRSQQYLGRLQDLAAAQGVPDEIVFVAHELEITLSTQIVSELYTIADALLMPSSQEGFGLPVIEAGAARLPAIVAGIPTLREIGGRDVMTFELDQEPEAIAGKILEFLDNPASRLFRRVWRDYRWEALLAERILPLLPQRVEPNCSPISAPD